MAQARGILLHKSSGELVSKPVINVNSFKNFCLIVRINRCSQSVMGGNSYLFIPFPNHSTLRVVKKSECIVAKELF